MSDFRHLNYLETVHYRDVDIHYNYVGDKVVNFCHRLHPVCCLAYHLKLVSLLVKQSIETFSDYNLIINKQYS